MQKLLAGLAFLAVAAACHEQALAPVSETPAISADFTNNLDGGADGLVHYIDRRGDVRYSWCWTDPTNSLRV
jgi:hypothetical protein